MLRRFLAMSLVGGGAWILAAAGPRGQQPTAEQAVWQVLIQRHGGGRAALADSTLAVLCTGRPGGGECPAPGNVPADAWASYQALNRERVSLRDRLPAGLQVRWQRDQPAPERPSCRVPIVLSLSRVGFSADSTAAVASYNYVVGPDVSGGCGYASGSTVLLQRTRQGRWRQVRVVGGAVT